MMNKDKGKNRENEGVSEVLEELEKETPYVMVDGVSTSLRDVIRRVLSNEDDENERRWGEG